MINLEPKYDFTIGPCEKFNKYTALLKHLFNPKLLKLTQNKNMQTYYTFRLDE